MTGVQRTVLIRRMTDTTTPLRTFTTVGSEMIMILQMPTITLVDSGQMDMNQGIQPRPIQSLHRGHPQLGMTELTVTANGLQKKVCLDNKARKVVLDTLTTGRTRVGQGTIAGMAVGKIGDGILLGNRGRLRVKLTLGTTPLVVGLELMLKAHSMRERTGLGNLLRRGSPTVEMAHRVIATKTQTKARTRIRVQNLEKSIIITDKNAIGARMMDTSTSAFGHSLQCHSLDFFSIAGLGEICPKPRIKTIEAQARDDNNVARLREFGPARQLNHIIHDVPREVALYPRMHPNDGVRIPPMQGVIVVPALTIGGEKEMAVSARDILDLQRLRRGVFGVLIVVVERDDAACHLSLAQAGVEVELRAGVQKNAREPYIDYRSLPQ